MLRHGIWLAAVMGLVVNGPVWARPRDSQVSGEETPAASQSYASFVRELQKATVASFREAQLNQIFRNHSALLTPQLDTTRLVGALTGNPVEDPYPLRQLRGETFYRPLLTRLLASKNIYQRILAFATVAAAGDNSFNPTLLQAIKSDKHKGVRQWAGLALLELRDGHTSELFDFLVAHEDFGDPHMLPLYFRLDPESLRQTAYEKVASQAPQAKILAIQSLLHTPPHPKTEQVVKEAVRIWKPDLKGYAIYVLGALKLPGQKALLQPWLSQQRLRGVCLGALANSPSQEDQEFLSSLAGGSGEVAKDVLDAYLESESPEQVKKWLALLRQRTLPKNYSFFVRSHPLLASDALLADVQETLRSSVNLEVLGELPRALEGRQDEVSVGLLVGLLGHADSTVRYWAAESLEGNRSALVVSQLPSLLRDAGLRTTPLTQLAIDNKVEGLRDVFLTFWLPKPSQEQDWRRSALDYLAAFPKAEDIPLFRSILTEDEDAFTRRTAAEGLGNLGDAGSVEAILAALAREPPNDHNAVTYLEALGKIGGERARAVLGKYRASRNPEVRRLVERYLGP